MPKIKVSDLQVYDMIDLEGDQYADPMKDHPEYEFSYSGVIETEIESSTVTIVHFNNASVGFPPDYKLEWGGSSSSLGRQTMRDAMDKVALKKFTDNELDSLAYKVKEALDSQFGTDSNDSPFKADDLNDLMLGYLTENGWELVPPSR